MKDNYDLWCEHEEEQEAWLRRLPVCCVCDEHIQQEDAVRINGEFYCDDCLDNMREVIEGCY